MRRPRIPKDRVYGYADLTYIDRLELDQPDCRLHLATGTAVELYYSAATARAALSLGKDIAFRYLLPAPAKDDQIVWAARLLLDRLERIECYLQQLTNNYLKGFWFRLPHIGSISFSLLLPLFPAFPHYPYCANQTFIKEIICI
jgi:hypothetical protein